jgi:hypothetical protein
MTDQEGEHGAEIVPRPDGPPELLAVPADTSYELELDERPAAPAAPVYADISPPEGARLPVIPAHLQTWGGIKAAAGRQAGRQAHRAAYHGIRAPLYLITALWWAVIGGVPDRRAPDRMVVAPGGALAPIAGRRGG